MAEEKSLRIAYGEALVKPGAKSDKVVAMDANPTHATMSSMFADTYPDRFFNFGTAETNLVCAAVGFAYLGLIPFASTLTLFGTGRAHEQIRNGVTYVDANMKFGLSHPGLYVGEDGGSYQSIGDLALTRVVPNMAIFVPCNPIEIKKAVSATAEINGPVHIRVACPVCDVTAEEDTPFILGETNVMRDGIDVCLVVTGLMVPEALKATKLLAADGINATIVSVHTIRPFGDETILKMAEKCGVMVSVEEHSIIGGLGSAAAEALASKSGVKFDHVGVMDKFGKSGKPADLFRVYGLTLENTVTRARVLLK